ncbi:hypothetical protein CF8_0046 [Aeromonas phage CF8]|nr:hypothetical protein CF8_0046 [Aeromonas phage CF8]
MEMLAGTVPKEMITHNVGFPGIPIETALSAVGVLLQAYGIQHDLPISVDNVGSLSTGDPQIDTMLTARYLELKNFLSLINETYNFTRCKCQTNGFVIYMVFECF